MRNDTGAEWDQDAVETFARVCAEFAARVAALDHNERLRSDEQAERPVWTEPISGEEALAAMVEQDRERVMEQAREFVRSHMSDLAPWRTPDTAGYDLWMTRTGEGVGFWSRYLPGDRDDLFCVHALSVRRDPAAVAEFDAAMGRLSEAARALPEVDAYVGDDGLIHVAG